MVTKQCDQTRCAFHSQMPMLCPRCAECQTAPHDINEECSNCWNCLKDEGYVRDGVPEFGTATAVPQEQEEMVEVKQ